MFLADQGPSELRRLRQLEEENSKLKRLVANLSLDKVMLQDALSKKALKASRKRKLATDLLTRFGVSMRKACAVMKLSRTVYFYRSQARDATAITMRIKQIAATPVFYGYRRVRVMLRPEGWKDNHKCVYRFYRAEGCSLKHKRPKRNNAASIRQPRKLASAINEIGRGN